MNRIEIAKTITNFIVGAGTTKIVHAIIKNNVQPENIIDTVEVAAGSLVLGSLVADVSRKYTNAKIDAAVAWWNTNVTKN